MGEYVEGEGACGSVGEGAEEVAEWEMMLFGFGRVPGCLGLGALFLCGWEEWGEGRTDSLPAGRLHGRAWCGRFAGSY